MGIFLIKYTQDGKILIGSSNDIIILPRTSVSLKGSVTGSLSYNLLVALKTGPLFVI